MNPDNIHDYLELCGGEDVFEFTTAEGEPDMKAAHEFVHTMLEQLPRESIRASYNRVWLTLEPATV